MPDYDNILDALRNGESADGVDLGELLGRQNSSSPQGTSSAVMPVNPGAAGASDTTILSAFPTREKAKFPTDNLSQTTRTLSAGPSSGGKGPSMNMDDANAFIRANREKGGDQIAALFQGQGKSNVPGVRAEVGPDGNIILTNVAETQPVPNTPTSPTGRGPGAGTIAPNTPLSINGLYNSLKQANDVDTARGIAAQMRTAGAVETSKYETQAVQFAENQLGIPKLQSQLQEAISADLADPKYTPGMGDSPYTARIRTALEDARSRALTNSKVYLNNNADYATLKATMANADAEVARITKLGDRKTAIADQTEAELQRQKNLRNFQAQDVAQALDPDMQQRIIMLNPELKDMTADDKMTQMGKIFQNRGKADKAWAEAITTPSEQLPVLAVSGNAYARRLAVSKEMANTGESESVIQARLDDIQKIALNPKFDDAAKKYFGDTKQGKQQAQAYIDTLNTKGLDKDGKAAQNQIRFQTALAMERQQTTIKFRNDLSSWRVSPSTRANAEAIVPGASAFFDDAVTQSRKVTGRTDMMTVFNQYLGDSQGPERIKRGQAFVELMKGTASQKQDSMFGVPDARALTTQLNNEISKNWFRKAYEAAGDQFKRTVQIMPMTGIGEAMSKGVDMISDAPVELDVNAVK